MANKTFINAAPELLEKREQELYGTKGDTRDPFSRDYTRILHCNAYRRLKHKTQVFYNISNDHVCTRMEHVSHVESVSHSIAVGLGLNLELTKAIAYGHDLGHAPFGHHGERTLNALLKRYLTPEYQEKMFDGGRGFWHEKNGLRFVDGIELLANPDENMQNLNLTYAVRDGIISHCGEVDENGLIPRKEAIDLATEFKHPGQFMPFTWEGCVVKVSDKIAYLGRDIEDAFSLHFISPEAEQELRKLSREMIGHETLNTTNLMHSLISDIVENSSPDRGILLSPGKLELLDAVKQYNYRWIYRNRQFETYEAYAQLVLESIFHKLYDAYAGVDTLHRLQLEYGRIYPRLSSVFIDWLCKYCDREVVERFEPDRMTEYAKFCNRKIYGNLENRDIYVCAIVDFISGMTDPFAIQNFNELISFA